MMKHPSEHSGFSPEARLLLRCARVHLDSGHAEEICRLAQQKLDWLTLLGMAYGHMVRPLVYRHLSGVSDLVPASILEHMKKGIEADYSLRRHQTEELSKALDAFAAENIATALIKGPAFAVLAYGDVGLRHFIGLEVLLRERDVPKAWAILKSQRYQPRVDLPPGHVTAFLRHQHEYVFGRDDYTTIHLCWRVAPRFFPPLLDTDAIWERLVPVRMPERDVRTLSAEDSLLALALFSAKQRWERLRRVSDVAELLRSHPELDWDRILGQARARGAARMVFVGLQLAHDLLDAPVPEPVRKQMQADRAVGSLASGVKKRFSEGIPLTPGPGERVRIAFSAFSRVRDKIRFLVRLSVIPTGEDWARRPLPEAWIPFYAVLRPYSILRRLGQAVLNPHARADLGAYEPTEMDLVERILMLAEVGPSDVVYDLGCGDGRIVIAAAKRFGARGVGVDLNPRCVAEAQENSRREGVEGRVRFLKQDAKQVDLSEATVVTLFLLWSGNYVLRPILQRQLRPGTRLVSFGADMGDWVPDKTITVQTAGGLTGPLHLWRIAKS
jgi:SAM-dependent methyltransferase